MKKFSSTVNYVGVKARWFCFTKVFGRFVGISMALKAKRKKQDKKKKK